MEDARIVSRTSGEITVEMVPRDLEREQKYQTLRDSMPEAERFYALDRCIVFQDDLYYDEDRQIVDRHTLLDRWFAKYNERTTTPVKNEY